MMDFECYHSFEECPLDDPPPPDGDDSLHAHDMGAGLAVLLAPKVPPTTALGWPLPRPTLGPVETTRKLVVPHPRDLKRKMAGKDVLALQRALSVAGFHSWNLRTGQFGAQLEKDVRRFQTAKKIKVDGQYGQVTHAHLAASRGPKGQPAYDGYGINLLLGMMSTPMEKSQQTLVAAAMALYNIRSRVHYTQGPSRMWIVKNHVKTAAGVSKAWAVYEDCSSSATGLYYIAGVPDPNQFRFNGLGYTGTLSVCGRRWTRATKPPIGALAFYGRAYPWTHVSVIINRPATGSSRVFSHGSEAGPYLLDVDYRSDHRQTREYSGMNYI